MKKLPPLYGVSSVDSARLEQAGVTDLRALAELANADEVARLTDVEPERLEQWRQEARRELSARRTGVGLGLGIAGVLAAAVLVHALMKAPRSRPEDYHSTLIQASLDEEVTRQLAALKSDPQNHDAQAALAGILSDSLAAARHLRDEKEWDEALHIYGRALQIDSNNAEARFYSGWIFICQRRYDDAVRTFRLSLPSTPQYRDWTYLNLGIAEASSGNESQAEETLKQASANFVPAMLQRTVIARSNGRRDEAEGLYLKILDIEPGNEAAIYGLYDLTEAPKYRQRLEQLGGRYGGWLKAEDAIRAGDFSTAVRVYLGLLQATPDDQQTVRLLGQTYVRWGVSQSDPVIARKGIERLETVVSRGDAPPETIFALAWAYQAAPGAARNLIAAKTYYQSYLDQVPSDHAASNNLTGILLAAGDRAGFLALSRKNLAMMPHDADAHTNVGYGLYLAGDLDGALKEYQAALAIDKLSPLPPLLLGEAELWQGSLKLASAHFEQARQLARRQGGDGAIWTLLLMSPSGGEKTDRLIYYDTLPRKEAGLDLLQTMVLLRENRGAEAQKLTRAALGRLGDSPQDVDIVRRGLSQLARLETKGPMGKDGQTLRAALEDWTKQRSSG